jgi:hypothetical protein
MSVISWPVQVWRGRLVPAAILAAVVVLGVAVFTTRGDGSDLATTAEAAGPATEDPLSDQSDTEEPAAAGGPAAEPSRLTLPSPLHPTTTGEATSTSQATTASTSPPATTSCADPWADLAGCGWPGPGNTGPRSANCPGGLSDNPGATTRQIVVTDDNAVISCQRITGALVIRASNVTVSDSVVSFDGGGGTGGGVIVIDGGASATIDHVEIDGLNHTHTCVWHQGESVLIDGINCHGSGDGVFAWAYTNYSPTEGDDFTIRNSYFHDFTLDAANGHMDGFQTEGTANGVISHNTFHMPIDATSAVAIWNSAKSSKGITVSDNLITGAQYSVYAMDKHPSGSSPDGGNSVTDITFTDNLFSTKTAACVGEWGAWYTDADLPYQAGPTDGWRRSGNHVLETGQNIDHGNPDCR